MKKLIIMLAVFVLSVCLLSCSSKGTYDEGFEDGYFMGYYDASVDFEDDYSHGYEDGYDDAADDHDYYIPGGYSNEIIDIMRDIQSDAESYASSNSEYDIESAMVIVDCYLNNKPDDWGEWYSLKDFKEASLILYQFYEYFYGQHYQ